MIAAAAWWQLEHLGPSPLETAADPNLRLRLLVSTPGTGGPPGTARLPRGPGPAIVSTRKVRVLMPTGGSPVMKLHPLEDRIVVRPGESEETTASGLVIPDTAKEKPQQGEVLAAGPGRRAETTGELVPIDVAGR